MKKYIYTCDRCGKDISNIGEDVELIIKKTELYSDIAQKAGEIQLCLGCYKIFDNWIKQIIPAPAKNDQEKE